MRLAREPLLHFLVLGAALFALHGLVTAETDPPDEIVVSRGRIESLAGTFERTWQRPPAAAELTALVEDHVREEVLYREAIALGLDRDDTVVRRRLRQKLEFLIDGADLAVPTDAELARHLAEHADRYRGESRLGFRQVFLDPARRGASLEADAAALLDALRSRSGAPGAGFGDALLLLEPHYEDLSESEIASLFGPEFAAALGGAPVGEWVGPLRSGYGAHIVRIDAHTPGRAAELREVRGALVRDLAALRRQELLDAQYQALRGRYRIRIESAPAAAAVAGAP